MFASLLTFLPKPLKALAIRFDKSPIDTVESLTEFVRTRSSYVAQTSLYGYLKTRMGTRFPEFFEHEVFSTAIRQSAVKLFVSCLGDLTVHAVALAGDDRRLSAAEAAALAHYCFENGLERMLADMDPESAHADAVDDFRNRTAETIWANVVQCTDAFAGSQRDIIRFAPVVDEFKALDSEIVQNSIRFRWRDIREQLRKRIDAERICDDWRNKKAQPTATDS